MFVRRRHRLVWLREEDSKMNCAYLFSVVEFSLTVIMTTSMIINQTCGSFLPPLTPGSRSLGAAAIALGFVGGVPPLHCRLLIRIIITLHHSFGRCRYIQSNTSSHVISISINSISSHFSLQCCFINSSRP